MLDKTHFGDEIRTINELLRCISPRKDQMCFLGTYGKQLLQFIQRDESKGIGIVKFIEDDHIPRIAPQLIHSGLKKLCGGVPMLFLCAVASLRESETALPNFNLIVNRSECLDGFEFSILPAALDELENEHAQMIPPCTHRHPQSRRCFSLSVTSMDNDEAFVFHRNPSTF